MERLQDPQSVRELLREQWPPAVSLLAILVGVTSWWLNRHVPALLYAIMLGILIGGAVWLVLLLLAARGWIAFIFDD